MSEQTETVHFYDEGERLPDDLPSSPFPIFKQWFDQAWDERITPNANSMTISTLHEDGYPDSRIVLCKEIEPDGGSIVFYTNYNGAKGKQLAANPFASVVFHWDQYERQVRIRGPIVHANEEESDRYFASRRLESRLGAWISDQSQPIESREALLEKASEVISKLNLDATALMNGDDIEIPRPPHWGGFRLHAMHTELWAGGVGRIHDRARWTRDLRIENDQPVAGEWSSTRLQP
jgi:pyridoxamine 5'-phosphate oxidase